MENLNTTNVTDMYEMFYGCSSLKSLELSNFNTANVTEMQDLFHGCSSLESLNLSSFNTANVPSLYGLFYDCSSLKSLDLSNFNTTKVENLNSMFQGCSSLESIDLSSFNTAKVVSMSQMFYGCSSLTSLDVSNFNTTKVEFMSEMFYDCSNLESLDVSNFKTANVGSMSQMFYGCSSLKSLDLRYFDTEKAGSNRGWSGSGMKQMFQGCSSLTTIYCEEAWTCDLDLSKNMFEGCISLIGAISYCSDITDITGANPTNGYFTSTGEVAILRPYAVLSDDNTKLTFYYDANKKSKGGMGIGPFNMLIKKGNEFVPNISWYGQRKDIKTVSFDKSFANYTDLFSTRRWFYECSNLTAIIGIENLKTDNVTDMYEMFNGCSSLESLDLTNFNTANVTDMISMFYGCSSLINIYCDDAWSCGYSSKMFKECTSLNGVISYDASKIDVTYANPTTGYFIAVKKGDANADNKITDEDVKVVADRLMLDMTDTTNKFVFAGADSNGDKEVNVADIVDIINKKE